MYCYQWSSLSSNWRSLSTELFTGLCLGTCLISWAALLTFCLGLTSVINFQPVYCLSITSHHSWRMIICFCWPKPVEQSSRWHYICFITDSVFTKTENSLFRQSYPDIIMQLVCGCSRHGGPSYLGHLENCNVMWLLDMFRSGNCVWCVQEETALSTLQYWLRRHQHRMTDQTDAVDDNSPAPCSPTDSNQSLPHSWYILRDKFHCRLGQQDMLPCMLFISGPGPDNRGLPIKGMSSCSKMQYCKCKAETSKNKTPRIWD